MLASGTSQYAVLVFDRSREVSMTAAACRIWTSLERGARLAQASWGRGGPSHMASPLLLATGGQALASMHGAISLPPRRRPCGDPPAMAARLLAGSLLLTGMSPAGDLLMQRGGQEAGASTAFMWLPAVSASVGGLACGCCPHLVCHRALHQRPAQWCFGAKQAQSLACSGACSLQVSFCLGFWCWYKSVCAILHKGLGTARPACIE